MNFVFWVIVHGIADHAFKGISTVTELLAKRPPNPGSPGHYNGPTVPRTSPSSGTSAPKGLVWTGAYLLITQAQPHELSPS